MCADVAEIGSQGDGQLHLTPGTPPIRILVVEDNEPFRNFISSMLRQHANLQIICEEKDGLQAVQQAQALQPDLILLDIGLPGLNGIQAARRIREVASSSKIIFLTQESAPEVVEEALASGAHGYVVKTQAGSELLTALETVLRGSRFVGCGLNAHAPCG